MLHETAMPLSVPLSLYIHWPYCRAKCPYCDFNSHVAAAVDYEAFATAYGQEMRYLAEHYGDGRKLHSIFFGGGTPSLMPGWLVANIIDMAADIFGFSDNVEITAEANPTSTEMDVLEDFQRAGINRVSLGVQALTDEELGFLGREHSVHEALCAVEKAQAVFDRTSIDLIYALRNQSADAWERSLRQAVSIGLDHMSIYQLTIEAGTNFYTRARAGEMLTAENDHAADLYEMTAEILEGAGYTSYEISNHAKPGAECRHNLVYWRAQDWLGIGPGAHGRITGSNQRIGLATRRNPDGWLHDVANQGHGIETKTADELTDMVAEILMMGLRLAEGVSLDRLTGLTGSLERAISIKALTDMEESQLVERKDGRLSVTATGRPLLNSILTELMTHDCAAD